MTDVELAEINARLANGDFKPNKRIVAPRKKRAPYAMKVKGKFVYVGLDK